MKIFTCMKYQNYNTCIFLAFRNYAWCCSFYLHLGWCTRARSTAWRDLGLTPWTLLCWSGSAVWRRDSYTCTGNTKSHKCSVFIQQTIQNVYIIQSYCMINQNRLFPGYWKSHADLPTPFIQKGKKLDFLGPQAYTDNDFYQHTYKQ